MSRWKAVKHATSPSMCLLTLAINTNLHKEKWYLENNLDLRFQLFIKGDSFLLNLLTLQISHFLLIKLFLLHSICINHLAAGFDCSCMFGWTAEISQRNKFISKQQMFHEFGSVSGVNFIQIRKLASCQDSLGLI